MIVPFQPQGPLLVFTAATAAPTSVQAISLANEQAQQYLLTNADGTNDAIVGWGASDGEAKLNAAAAATVRNCIYLMRGTQVILTAGTNQFFSGIAVSGTAAVKVQAGTGE